MSAIQLLVNACRYFQKKKKQNLKYKSITRTSTVKRVEKVTKGTEWQRELVQLPL